jgi:hypothetical protein
MEFVVGNHVNAGPYTDEAAGGAYEGAPARNVGYVEVTYPDQLDHAVSPASTASRRLGFGGHAAASCLRMSFPPKPRTFLSDMLHLPRQADRQLSDRRAASPAHQANAP